MERAKEIFFNYSGSKFQMMRDGLVREYESYEISSELEKKWLEELIENEFKKLDFNSLNSFFPLWYILQTNQLFEYYDRLEKFIWNGFENTQNYTKSLMFVEKILNILNNINPDNIEKIIYEITRFKELKKKLEKKKNN